MDDQLIDVQHRLQRLVIGDVRAEPGRSRYRVQIGTPSGSLMLMRLGPARNEVHISALVAQARHSGVVRHAGTGRNV
ncbi:hypothetical protein ACGFXB_46940 [Streptomyces canus]|uniref:hypothetical protein n=1 Tax=Streptomyces canus TaxID=58343 RepID=UPI00371BF01B